MFNQINENRIANDILREVKQKLEEAEEDRRIVGDDYAESPEEIARHVMSGRSSSVTPSIYELVMKCVATGSL